MADVKAAAMRNEYLDAMGIQRWELRDQIEAPVVEVLEGAAPVHDARIDDERHDEARHVAGVEVGNVAPIVPAEVTEPDQSQLQSPPQLRPISVEMVSDDPVLQRQKRWARLQNQVAQCSACDLHQQRIQPVFGVGNQQAQCLVISDAPGVEEDKLGEPIVGPAGILLNGMLRAIGLSRKTAYITNIIKCHSPDHRALRSEELASCRGYLQHQIALIQPAVILVLGKVAAQSLLDSMENVGALRGKVHVFGEFKIPLVVSYHPSYLLRKPLDKRKAWVDLQLAQSAMLAAEHDV